MIVLKRKLMTSLLPSSTGGRHGAQRSGSTNLTIIEFIINDSEYNKEVLEHFIDKLNKLNNSIKEKV